MNNQTIVETNFEFPNQTNIYKGKVTFKGVADALNLSYTPPDSALSD